MGKLDGWMLLVRPLKTTSRFMAIQASGA